LGKPAGAYEGGGGNPLRAAGADVRVGYVLADLHLHLNGCVRAADLLRQLSGARRVRWEWYEAEMAVAYGVVPATRQVVERHRQGEAGAAAAFEELFAFGDADGAGFDRFQAKFTLLLTGLSRSDPDATPAEIEAETAGIAAGIRADHRRHGIAYAEHRVMLGADLDAPGDRAVLDTLLAAYDTGADGVTERLAISLHRADPWAGWQRVQELAVGPHGRALTAVDFCGTEEGHPPKEQAPFFAAVRQFNAAHPDRALAILYHVGETFGDKSLESAVRWVHEAAVLGANRLGHAIALGVDPDVYGPHTRTETVAERIDQIAYDLHHRDQLWAAGVPVDAQALLDELTALSALPGQVAITVEYDRTRLEQVRRRQRYALRCIRATDAVIEVCPTSNRRIAGIGDPAHHPVHQFLAAGLPTVVSSDNPGLFATSLADELDWVCRHTGGGSDLRHHLVQTAWNSRSEVLAGRLLR
jgi:adenosine deaminase